MSEFFQPPPPPGSEQPSGGNPPPWTGRPQGRPPGEVGSDLALGRSETVTVSIAYLDAYPEGFEFDVEAVSVAAVAELCREGDEFGPDVFGRNWPRAGDRRDVIPAQVLRFGVQFADGRKATNIIGHDQPADGPTMWSLQGGGTWSVRGGEGGGRFHQGYWVSPLPPPGPVAFVCEWPAGGIGLVRQEVDAQLILDAAERSRAVFPTGQRVFRDGREWRLGTDADVAWIDDGRSPDRAVSIAVPTTFASYCTLALPGTWDDELTQHERAVIELLVQHTPEQPWWLGYLDTGASDVVFPYAPRATLYYGYGYVLVQAGPEQAAGWRDTGFSWRLPELIFPADRSWLLSTMWDDDWTSIGASEQLVSRFLRDATLGPRARRGTGGPAR